MRDILIELAQLALGVALLFGIGLAIVSLAKENEERRQEQKAACIAAGGKYAQSLRNASGPSADYCIRN